ncbi:serine/threonine-protein kinase [Vitiosangium sp. GDMCC 1.1324]|uniref:serine/threonine-protein kinase n=1 Tax=Vitiosangium sp. (strain GDMCC 1.1324) TaxID=2138576 RepID=UPI000D3D3F23|nr:serine/threonine-protein kinase [Vitiosangium sp. GDMCC 1.1324]PTL79463.1 serine/threonine-protein kinase PknK [Vitiosangium sp. GDMCC 1.1324]
MAADSTETSPLLVPLAGGGGPPPPPRGTLIAGRFLIEDLAGRGGMGFVFRATDQRTGQTVALKLMKAVTSPAAAYRFNREAVLLSELHHPAIVSYVAHGTSEEGQPFLVMEWLEGEDLARRLLREPLDLSETLALVHRAAEGLAIAHRQGIVHRDIKPSNLFLRGGRPEDVVLLDFGLARHVAPTLVRVTSINTVLGTQGYMAPEQASSEPEIPACADIFSLGCVLYECLAGQPPFKAPHFSATLAKILYTEPKPLHELRPGLPQGLQVLVDCMLAKKTQRRLPDATHLLESLKALESVPSLLRAEKKSQPTGLAGAEQQLVSVLLASDPGRDTGEQEEDTRRGLTLRDSMRTALAPYGAQVERLADGTLVATLTPERGTATDQAALAARCALTLKDRWPEAAVVLATGRGVLAEHLPVGEAMDRAGRLLRQLEQAPTAFACVLMDEVTAGLLGPGFQLSRSSSGSFLLQGEQLGADTSRPLLGKPTPCVGREQELALLEFTLSSCHEESSARALLVTAPPGTGKSRLRHEFLRRIERWEQPVLVLLGRGEPMSTGASYGLLGQALRMLCGVVEGEDAESHRARLTQRLSRHLPPAEAKETVEFLGELCALPFPDDTNPRLRAARGDPRLMNAQMGRALVYFLKAECAHHPVLLVLEDLHWSDALTIKLVDELLRELAEQPLLVLALARPEVKTLFPHLWSRRLQEVPLNGLSRKASARLVREVLGPQVPDNIVQKAVEQSDGNALFLEELIRMLAEGRGEEVPQTVLAVLQARLMRMEPGVRQTLLAASIFGRTFWSGGVKELLGGSRESKAQEQHLRWLVEQEVIEPLPSSRFRAENEYRFRHALVRDAAYGLVPDDHRPMGHRLAGDWLERVGEPEPLVLATHHWLGERPERATHFYTRAAEQLFERHDLQGTMRCVEGALGCGASGELLTRLRALQAVVAFWMDQLPRALELGIPVLARMKAGSALWCRLMGDLSLGSALDRHGEHVARLSDLLLHTTPEPDAVAAYLEAINRLGAAMSWSGARQRMELLVARALKVGAGMEPLGARARGWMRFAQAYFLYYFEARPWQAFTLIELAERDFREIGSERDATLARAFSGAALAALGDLPGAVAYLREALAVAQRTEQRLAVTYAQRYLATTLARSPELEHQREAETLAEEWMNSTDAYKWGNAHAMRAWTLAARGEPREAEPYARKACELLMPFLNFLAPVRALHSTVLRAQGRAVEARHVAELGMGELARMGNEGVHAVAVHLALVEARFADGDASAGEAALREALRCVRERASDISDPTLRERFLHRVPENARTLELARQRWGESPP